MFGGSQNAAMLIGGGFNGTTFDSGRASSFTLSSGNLVGSGTATTPGVLVSTTLKSTGKFYYELIPLSIASGNNMLPGLAQNSINSATELLGFDAAHTSWAYLPDGRLFTNSALFATIGTYVANNVLGFALDITGNQFFISKNNAWQGGKTPGSTSGYTLAGGGNWVAAASPLTVGNSVRLIAASSSLNYTPPTGYAAWE